MKLSAVIQLVFFIFIGNCVGQNCGVSVADQESWAVRYAHNLENRNLLHQRTLAEIPIVFHLVGRQNGVGRAAIKESLALICQLNEDFKGSAITFFLAENGINLINDDGIFASPQLAINKVAMQKYKNPKAINVFVVNKINDGGAIGIYDASEDWILIHKSAFLSRNKTLAHEIGHFFSLYHPHFGWEAAPWTNGNDGMKVGLTSADGKTPTENMNGVNCYLAGDKLCDTAPDYNFGLNWQKSCTFGGIAMDPNGTRVIPDESLIMSYFNDSCRNKFTQEQIGLMRADLSSDGRQFLFSGTIPLNLPLGNNTQFIEPQSMANYSGKDSITFSWNAVSNANQYYLEVDRSPNFNLDPKGILVRENNIKFAQNWIEGINYYARLFSWNEQNTCLEPSHVLVFQVSTISANTDWSLERKFNFHYLNQTILANYNETKPGPFFFQLYNLKGEIISNKTIMVERSGQNIPIFEGILPQGMYVMRVIGNHNYAQKIMILD